MPSKADTPMRTAYRPELDVSPELEPAEAAYYQSIIGILRWIVELGRVDICAADIRNSYLQAPSSQKDYIVCGPEFGIENVGRIALIHCALYGGKSAGKDFRNHLRSCMRYLDFVSCPVDPDAWMRPAKHSDGT